MERTRAAIRARAGETPVHLGGGVLQCSADEIKPTFGAYKQYGNLCDNIQNGNMFDTQSNVGNLPHQSDAWRPALPDFPTVRSADPPAPTVRASSPAPVPAQPLLAFSTPGELVAGLGLSAGAVRVFTALHALACDVARQRAYAVAPDTVTLHLPQSLLAVAVGYTPRHLRNLLPELVRAGLLDWGAHASKVRGMGLWGGCLFGVKVQAGSDVVPHLGRAEWRHEWRDLEGDIDAGRTVKALLEGISSLHTNEWENAVQDALKAWAVNPGNLNSPVDCKAEMEPGEGLDAVQDVRQIAYRLGELPHIHATKRAALVGRLASALSRALGDTHSRRWYCLLIWSSWRGEIEGRGTLQSLCAALVRLETDRREWEGLRNPAALLVSRLRPA